MQGVVMFDEPEKVVNWTAPPLICAIELLIVAGGGGGGWESGGGGGAGGLLYYPKFSVTPGLSYLINVGIGGQGATGKATAGNGGNSSFGAFIGKYLDLLCLTDLLALSLQLSLPTSTHAQL